LRWPLSHAPHNERIFEILLPFELSPYRGGSML